MEYDILSLDEIEPGMMMNLNPVKGKDSYFLLVVEINDMNDWTFNGTDSKNYKCITCVLDNGELRKQLYTHCDVITGKINKYRVIRSANE